MIGNRASEPQVPLPLSGPVKQRRIIREHGVDAKTAGIYVKEMLFEHKHGRRNE